MNAIKDKTFKHLFTNAKLLTNFLENIYSYLGIDGDLNISYLNGQQLIPGEKINVKDFYGDIIAVTKDTIISLEAKGSYKELKKILCINLIAGNKPQKYDTIESYKMFDIKHQKDLEIRPLKYIKIYVDMVKEIPYNENEHGLITWLRILTSDESSTMHKYAKGDVIMEETIEYLERFYAEEGNSREDRFQSDLKDMKKIGYEEGLTKGKKEGINMTIKAMFKNIMYP